ncbi:MAG: hypothetical protein JWP29_1282 [Rhodoferax sp.]|nr:hypothetical protein [Rhodoferax sp.]
MQMSLDGWDYGTSTASFFVHWACTVGLYAFLTHYALAWTRHLQRRAASPVIQIHENT